jgi:type III secretory pathway component EscV
MSVTGRHQTFLRIVLLATVLGMVLWRPASTLVTVLIVIAATVSLVLLAVSPQVTRYLKKRH